VFLFPPDIFAVWQRIPRGTMPFSFLRRGAREAIVARAVRGVIVSMWGLSSWMLETAEDRIKTQGRGVRTDQAIRTYINHTA
jgi:hypothetical protein